MSAAADYNKVVSLVLFGSGDKYGQYLRAFVRAHLNLFPQSEEWSLRVHVDDIVRDGEYGAYLKRLESAGLVETRNMGSAPLTAAMLWRLAPVFDPAVDYVFCRDLDACPMPRDRACCDAFIVSQCVVHTIHDNVAHFGIMGGLCGFVAPAFRTATGMGSLADLYAWAAESDTRWARHGTDQEVLGRLLDQGNGPSLLEHRFAGWAQGQPHREEKRKPSHYQCAAWSVPVPDEAPPWPPMADRLAAHLGAAGFDHKSAVAFWDEHGDPEIAKRVAECER